MQIKPGSGHTLIMLDMVSIYLVNYKPPIIRKKGLGVLYIGLLKRERKFTRRYYR